MFEFFKDMNNYESRKVARDELKLADGNFIISTAYTSDEGYETAVFRNNQQSKVCPVERYPSKEDAIKGHKKWKSLVEQGQRDFTMLDGLGGLVGEQKFSL